jgi:hypothetical protein
LPSAGSQLPRPNCRRRLEKELIGFCLTPHPLQRALDDLDGVVTAYSGDLSGIPTGKPVAMAGIVTWIRPVITRAGYEMAKIGMEDVQGDFELVVFSRTWERSRQMVAVGKVLLVRGDVDNSRGEPAVRVQALTDRPTIYVPLDDNSPGGGRVSGDVQPAAMDHTISERGAGNGGFARSADPPPPPPPPPDEWEFPVEALEVAASPAKIPAKSVTVVLQPAAMEDIKPLMRRLVQLLDQQDGVDRFQLQIEGLDIVFDFPNMKTSWTPQLKQQVTGLHGVRRIRIE